MAQTLVNTRLRAAGTSVRAGPRAYWNPYLAGMLLGLVLLATSLVTGFNPLRLLAFLRPR